MGGTHERRVDDDEIAPDPVVANIRPLGYVSPMEQTSLVKAMNPRSIRRRHGISTYYKIENFIYRSLYWLAFWLFVIIIGLWFAVGVVAVTTGYVPW